MGTRVYALMVENEVFHLFPVEDEWPNAQRWAEGFNSNPISMDITNYPYANVGWTWDGEKFLPPESNN